MGSIFIIGMSVATASDFHANTMRVKGRFHTLTRNNFVSYETRVSSQSATSSRKSIVDMRTYSTQ
jgi:hypothetical protein